MDEKWPAAATRELLLAPKVMEERTFSYTGGPANVIDRGRGVALGANHGEGRIQQFSFRIGL